MWLGLALFGVFFCLAHGIDPGKDYYWRRCLRRPLQVGDVFTAKGKIQNGMQRWTCGLEARYAIDVFGHFDHRNFRNSSHPLVTYSHRLGTEKPWQPGYQYRQLPFAAGADFEITIRVITATRVQVQYSGKDARWPGATINIKGRSTPLSYVKLFQCCGDIQNVTLTGTSLGKNVIRQWDAPCPSFDSYGDDDDSHSHEHPATQKPTTKAPTKPPTKVPTKRPHSHSHNHSHSHSSDESGKWPSNGGNGRRRGNGDRGRNGGRNGHGSGRNNALDDLDLDINLGQLVVDGGLMGPAPQMPAWLGKK